MKYCEMLRSSGRNQEIQWFDWMPSFTASAPTRVEWDLDTMVVGLPDSVANSLIKAGYARPLTEEEIMTIQPNTPPADAPLPDPPASDVPITGTGNPMPIDPTLGPEHTPVPETVVDRGDTTVGDDPVKVPERSDAEIAADAEHGADGVDEDGRSEDDKLLAGSI